MQNDRVVSFYKLRISYIGFFLIENNTNTNVIGLNLCTHFVREKGVVFEVVLLLTNTVNVC